MEMNVETNSSPTAPKPSKQTGGEFGGVYYVPIH